MRKFLVKTLVMVAVVLICCLGVALLADGYADSSYLRLTSKKQTSLILGTSRAATGIMPDSLEAALQNTLNGQHIYNFAFTLFQTPYGEPYLEAVKKKLDTTTADGLFILTVDPWAISTLYNSKGESEGQAEEKLAPGNMYLVNTNPNIEYLVKNFNDPYFKLIQNRISPPKMREVHENGWFEMRRPTDSATVASYTSEEINNYKNDYLSRFRTSPERVEVLINIIQFLKRHGRLFLVRMPVSPGILEMEKKLEPGFDAIISKVITQTGIPYFDFSSRGREYTYSDGVHLSGDGAAKFSKQLGQMINGGR